MAGFGTPSGCIPRTSDSLLTSLRKAKIRSKMVGMRLIVQTEDPDQLWLPFGQTG